MSKRYIKDVFPTSEDAASGQLTLKAADLPGITTALMSAASATTGDWPSLLLSFLCQVHQKFTLMDAADEPNAVTIQRSDQVITSGTWEGKQLTQFVVRAYTDITDTAPVAADVT